MDTSTPRVKLHRQKVAEFYRELRAVPTIYLTIRERNRAIRSHLRHRLLFLWEFQFTDKYKETNK